MASSHKQPGSIVCNNCGAENPVKAYCCLSCFKVLRPKAPVPWWRAYIRPTFPMMFVLVGASLLGIYIFKRWMENIEAQISMNFKGVDYNVTVTADKKKKQNLPDVEAESSSNSSQQ